MQGVLWFIGDKSHSSESEANYNLNLVWFNEAYAILNHELNPLGSIQTNKITRVAEFDRTGGNFGAY